MARRYLPGLANPISRPVSLPEIDVRVVQGVASVGRKAVGERLGRPERGREERPELFAGLSDLRRFQGEELEFERVAE